MSRTYDIEQVEEIGKKTMADLANEYFDLLHGAITAGAAKDTMFQTASVTTNVGPGSGGAPSESPGASQVSAAWGTLHDRLMTAMRGSADAMERLSMVMRETAEAMAAAEADTEYELEDLQAEIEDHY